VNFRNKKFLFHYIYMQINLILALSNKTAFLKLHFNE